VGTQELLNSIRDAGVIGAGGAGFPTYKKLEAQVAQIIVNGAECEPLLQKDRESMVQDHAAMFRGLETMQQLTGASRVTIAVKRKNADVLDLLQDGVASHNYDTFIYEDVYPAGDEYCLVYEITGRQIPPGGLPLDVDCVVDNCETIINIGRAIEGTPVTQKYMTITAVGSLPGSPQNGFARNVYPHWSWAMRPVFFVYRVVPALHSRLSDRTASCDAHTANDRRSQTARQFVGSVLLRVQRLFFCRLSRTVGSQEHLRGCQAIVAREQDGQNGSGIGTIIPAAPPGTQRSRNPHQDSVSAIRADAVRSEIPVRRASVESCDR
jgi:hypothetical protein